MTQENKPQRSANSPSFQSLQEVRDRIDQLDAAIISLLGERFACVKAAAAFKRSTEEVKGAERFASMLQQRRAWASANGLSPDIIEQMFKLLVNYFIEEELKRWKSES